MSNGEGEEGNTVPTYFVDRERDAEMGQDRREPAQTKRTTCHTPTMLKLSVRKFVKTPLWLVSYNFLANFGRSNSGCPNGGRGRFTRSMSVSPCSCSSPSFMSLFRLLLHHAAATMHRQSDSVWSIIYSSQSASI